ncbi:MAG: fibronectin type III domain-containing protein, partial [Planctomycetes bacterium]|nr:fibronectin type III domain-containing protein [Planctomycetota bacterium]
GDWDTSDNYMRSILAARGHALITAWAGRPHWFFHPLGLGATFGDCARISQNNSRADYAPAGTSARGVHMALLGDPTLRMHVLTPPRALRLTQRAGGGIQISWRGPEERGIRYLVYRSTSKGGPFTRLTQDPLKPCALFDPQGKAGHVYRVKSIRLQKSPGGSYWNTSQGISAGGAR